MERIYNIYGKILKYFQQDSDYGVKDWPRNRKRGKRAFRRYIYARTQNLYKKNPSTLAKLVRNGSDYYNTANTQLNKEDITQLYNILWNTRPTTQQPYTNKITKPDTNIETEDILYTITTTEIAKTLTRIKKDTAAGPDGIRKNNTNNVAAREIIQLLFNLILITGEQPKSLSTTGQP
jgi:hypothetical protein